MKCTGCGWLFSPTNTRSSCPRCGKPISEQQSGMIGHLPTAAIQPQAFVPQQYTANNTAEVGPGVQQQDWNMPWNTAQTQFSWQSSPIPLSAAATPASTQTTDDHLGEPFFQAPTATPDQFAHFQEATSSPAFPQIPQTPQQVEISGKPPIPFGFTVASLCVITGGLILVLVYFLSLGAIAADNAALQSAANRPKKVPTVVSLPSPTAIPVTSTPYPAQQYVNNVVMASNVATTTAQPTMLSNTFKLRQKMYVTFEVRTRSAGGICLVWYINNKILTSFAFPIASSTSAYSFASSATVGTGYVEIYWSSTASCSDPNKQLAQKAQFTVTA